MLRQRIRNLYHKSLGTKCNKQANVPTFPDKQRASVIRDTEMDIVYVDILTEENLSSIQVVQWSSFIGQFFYPVGGEGMGYKGWMRVIIILASCKHHFIRVHEYLVQHPSNNIYRLGHRTTRVSSQLQSSIYINIAILL